MRENMWEKLPCRAKLLMLAAESTVMAALLVEDETLIAMLQAGADKDACLRYIHANW